VTDIYGQIKVIQTDITDGSEDGRMILSALVGGSLGEVVRAGNDGTNVTLGFFGVNESAIAPAYTPTNVSTDRAYDANSVVIAELADVVGTLIADLQAYGLLQ